LITKFPSLATSGRHNSAMITDGQKFTTKVTLYGRGRITEKAEPGIDWFRRQRRRDRDAICVERVGNGDGYSGPPQPNRGSGGAS